MNNRKTKISPMSYTWTTTVVKRRLADERFGRKTEKLYGIGSLCLIMGTIYRALFSHAAHNSRGMKTNMMVIIGLREAAIK